jgi:hypothetical protein
VGIELILPESETIIQNYQSTNTAHTVQAEAFKDEVMP